jgi:hypothetical protein
LFHIARLGLGCRHGGGEGSCCSADWSRGLGGSASKVEAGARRRR